MLSINGLRAISNHTTSPLAIPGIAVPAALATSDV
jgi:hypothetical protein